MPNSLGILAVLGLAVSSLAVPSSPTTHHIRDLEHGVRITTYQPSSVFETYEDNIEHPSRRSLPAEPKDIALAFLSAKLNVDPSNLFYRAGFSSEMATHAYVNQMHNGIAVANCVSNVAISQTGKIISYGSSFIKPASVASPTPSISVQNAISIAEKHLDGTYDNWPTEVKYFALDTDHVILTHTIQVKNSNHWFLAYVDAHSGEVVNVVDYTAHAKPPPPPPPPPTTKYQYSAVPFSYPDYTSHGFSTYTNPAYAGASPNGWHALGENYLTATTSGNNVIAFIGAASSTTKESAPGPKFIYPFDPTVSPKSSNNPAAATVNAFYIGNIIHDLAYRYGFREDTYNFQTANYRTGGLGGDPIQLSVQDTDGTNDARFHTPPDGQPGLCSMYLWTWTQLNRDGALSNDIITHEFTHGISNRMIGGGTADCLQTREAGGLGEGWSDTLAFAVEQLSATPKDWVIGSWVTDLPGGLRSHPYSISKTTNPLLYGDLQTRTEVHLIGEIWANVLVNVFWALTAKYGFGSISDPTSTAGNIVFLHLFFDAFPAMPCNPSFIDARSAIIIADDTRYGGANWCLLWNVFASRGLGAYAGNHQNNYDIPPKAGCVRNF